MPEVVEPDAWNLGLLDQVVEVAREPVRVHGAAGGIAEGEVVVGFPRWAGGESFLHLELALLSKRLDRRVVHVDGAPTARGLGLADDNLAVDCRHGLDDRYLRRVEVDVSPPKPEYLPSRRAGACEDRECVAPPRLLGDRGELLELIRRPRRHLRSRDRRAPSGRCCIALDESETFCVGQRPAEDHMRVLDRLRRKPRAVATTMVEQVGVELFDR